MKTNYIALVALVLVALVVVGRAYFLNKHSEVPMPTGISEISTSTGIASQEGQKSRTEDLRRAYSISSNELTTPNGFILNVPSGWTTGIDAPNPNYPHEALYDADKKMIAQINCPSAPKAEFFEEAQHAQNSRTFMKAGTTIEATYSDFANPNDSSQLVEADVYLAPKGLTYEDIGNDSRTDSTCRIISSGAFNQNVLEGFNLMYQTAR